jgi:uncharacterized protein (TIGR04255 family)
LSEPALPVRINPDAIVEALIEIRFDLGTFPEIFLGQVLTSSSALRLRPVRLPGADLPQSAKDSDSNLRYQPAYQLEGERELVRVGSNVLSIHRLPPYCGWDEFLPRCIEILRACWEGCGQPMVSQCGLRYINALRSDLHGVRTIDDLNLDVSVAGESIVDVTVSYLDDQDSNSKALVRVASKSHVTGELPENSTFVVDVDVQSKTAERMTDISALSKWLEAAHELEKRLFFNLLPNRIVEGLKETNDGN